ncbi:MAG: carboxypeptidase-like regulatory domain-containing protein [Gemmatimonadota bacterium]
MRARTPTLFAAAAGLTAALALGCETDPGDSLLSIDATGTVVGRAYLDRDGDQRLSLDADGPVSDVRLRLLVADGRELLDDVVTDESGEYAIAEVPVGRYRLAVDSSTVPDSIRVMAIDSAELTIAADDTVVASVRFGYPQLGVDDARATPIGRKVFVTGISLIAWETFGDSTVHLAGDTSALRAMRVQPAAIGVGDSVRFLGTMSRDRGQPILHDVTPFVVSAASAPVPDTVSTANAAAAEQGRLDAALVHVRDAEVTDTAHLVSGDDRIIVDDGSGELAVIFDRDGVFVVSFAELADSSIDVTGVLVPDGAGGWDLKPRSGEDVTLR